MNTNFYSEKRFEDFSDRKLMELILINQINIFQIIYRGNAFALQKFHGDLAKEGIHKDAAYLKLLDDAESFLMQYQQLIDGNKI